jgi:transcriptional regulator with XRE-family HTH domain
MSLPKQHSLLDDLLAEHPQQDADVFVALIADLAEQVKTDMLAQGLTRRALAQRLNKSESEITKWLSGMHNLTLQSVAKLSVALQMDLVTTRLNPLGYFGRMQPNTLSKSVEIFHGFETRTPLAGKTTVVTVSTKTDQGEQITTYDFAA